MSTWLPSALMLVPIQLSEVSGAGLPCAFSYGGFCAGKHPTPAVIQLRP